MDGADVARCLWSVKAVLETELLRVRISILCGEGRLGRISGLITEEIVLHFEASRNVIACTRPQVTRTVLRM
jgi:hypothetical protein